ncbi:cation efflux family-domain-containing protein [Naematelia encephala]|uniref:Cation efflux family-domain-containing protein n=1 Tax=Naematelia encephala TaxID=71784 RepID=A0A1Y2B4M7_9TREE|nr:cation efflux family-domain-containing protein [Naematelia encephala]
MQAAPTPLHRTSFPVPVDHRRVERPIASGSSSRRSIKTSRLLFAALATTASKTWVLNSDANSTGGIGWVLLGFCCGRVVVDVKERWSDRKGKKREVVQDGLKGTLRVTAAVLLSVQLIAFVLSLQSLGPLRTLVLLCFMKVIPHTRPTTLSSLLPLLPISTSLVTALWLQWTVSGLLSLIPPIILLGVSFVNGNPMLLALATKKPYQKLDDAGSRYRLSLDGAIATAISVFILWLAGIISNPFPTTHGHHTHLFPCILAAAIAQYLPIPSSFHSSPLSTSWGRLVILTSVFTLQFFALPPRPNRFDALAILPLALISDLFIGESVNTHGRRASDLASAISSSVGWSAMLLVPAAWRPHLRTILNTPSSSRIFYFLLLNLAYMGVQMGYGVLTNSLGLISDAIHMLFDCLGIGMGLWASVMATWKPDGRYTFGYSRVETLSGFANGCFLILISIFIMFEAIQRVIDPPEMDTHQLLLVSTIGLLINLFGMWATGGHHHHGHSHGHDHGHSHSLPVNDKKVDHRIDDGHGHHSHSDSNSHIHAQADLQVRRRSSGLFNSIGALQHEHEHHSQHDHKHHSQHDSEPCFDPRHDHASHLHSHTHSRDPYDTQKSDYHDHGQPNHHEHSHHEHSHHEHSHHDDSHNEHHDYHDHHERNGHSISHEIADHHDHSNGHSAHHHHHHSHNMRGVFLHVMADTLGSVGVIVSTILIKFTGWTGFDPIASLFIAALIMASVIPLVVDAGKILCLDVGAEMETEIRGALAELSSIDGLANYGAPRFWPRCEGELVGSIHIHLAPSAADHDPSRFSHTPFKSRQPTIYANAEKVVSRVEKVLKGRIRGLEELVIQVEGCEEKSFCSCMTSVR